MCGIAGFVQARPDIPADAINAQLRLLEHRGPDSSGWYKGGRAVIGQTRLAIIDLVTGDPPIENERGTIGVALNGEIYNYRELRRGLASRGHELKTTGDTEVIAHLAEELDPLSLAHALEGMFAIAVWNDHDERLVLVRDRLGKKPLYYWSNGAHFVFGSEIKALLAHPAVARELDSDAIPAYLTFGYVPTPRTFYKGIRSVPPGHVLVVEPGGAPRIDEYWRPRVPGASGVRRPESFDEAARTTRDLMREAVRRRLVSDVPLGAFLSGGIDSSAIVGLMSEVGDRPPTTFTIGFDDKDGYDERGYARLVATRFGTDHHEFVVAPEAVDLIERLVWHHDQPFGDSSAIPTYLLSELTRSEVKVALAGDGGDELFAGYERLAAALLMHRLQRAPFALRRGLAGIARRVPARLTRGAGDKARRFAGSVATDVPDALRAWSSFISEDRLRRLLRDTSDWAFRDYRSIWDSSHATEPLARILELNMRTYLLDDLLVKVDRMSMAHGLEVRAPFLDRELVEFALCLPADYVVRGLRPKRILKAAVRDLLPPEILDRGKKGFSVPLDRWFRADLSGYVTATLGSRDARVRSHLDSGELDALLEEHRRGVADHGNALWTLLTLEVFLRRESW